MIVNGYEYGGVCEGELHRKIVFECAAVARRYGVRCADFEDVVHEALLAAFKILPMYDEHRGTQVWTMIRLRVIGAATDVCFKLARERARQVSTEHGAESHGTSAAPELDAELSMRLAGLKRALGRLPVMQRKVLRLRYGLSGDKPMSAQQVADALGVSHMTVYRALAKAMPVLRKEIKKAGDYNGC